MGDWRPNAKIRVDGRAIYLWVVPAAEPSEASRGNAAAQETGLAIETKRQQSEARR
jgi:hypothetical protein